jgi:CheY-like chemotaxis protein
MPDGARILLIAISGYGRDEHRRRARQTGFDQHFVKLIDPVAITELLAKGRRGDARPGGRERGGFFKESLTTGCIRFSDTLSVNALYSNPPWLFLVRFAASRAAVPRPTQSRTILVVDDDRDAADTMPYCWNRADVRPAAYSAREGLDRLDERADICLVVSDIRMPGSTDSTSGSSSIGFPRCPPC